MRWNKSDEIIGAVVAALMVQALATDMRALGAESTSEAERKAKMAPKEQQAPALDTWVFSAESPDEKRKTKMTAEELAWEKALEENLGSYYLPRYKEAKATGQENWAAWDYVKDDPSLPRVLLIGDSISRGYTVPVRHALKGKANVHRIPCISTRASRTIKKLPEWLGSGKWDVIHINSGIHDRKADPAMYGEEIEAIVTQLEKTGAKLIWASTTPAPETGDYAGDAAIVKLNEVAAGIMKKHGIPIDDLYGFIKPRQQEWQRPDDCHFKEEKYIEIGNKVAEAILAALKLKTGKTTQSPIL